MARPAPHAAALAPRILTSKWLWFAVTASVWLGAATTWHERCEALWLRYSVDAAACSDGAPWQTFELLAAGVERGVPGRVQVTATARFVDDDGHAWTGRLPAVRDLTLALVDGDHETPVAIAGGVVTLPPVPDGDYQLRARFRTPLGPGEVRAALPLHAPAGPRRQQRGDRASGDPDRGGSQP